MTERPVPGSAAARSDVSSTEVLSAELTTAQVDGVLALAQAAAAADGVAPLSEHVLLHLRYDHSSAERGSAASQDIVLVTGSPPRPAASSWFTRTAGDVDLAGPWSAS